MHAPSRQCRPAYDVSPGSASRQEIPPVLLTSHGSASRTAATGALRHSSPGSRAAVHSAVTRRGSRSCSGPPRGSAHTTWEGGSSRRGVRRPTRPCGAASNDARCGAGVTGDGRGSVVLSGASPSVNIFRPGRRGGHAALRAPGRRSSRRSARQVRDGTASPGHLDGATTRRQRPAGREPLSEPAVGVGPADRGTEQHPEDRLLRQARPTRDQRDHPRGVAAAAAETAPIEARPERQRPAVERAGLTANRQSRSVRSGV